MEEVQKEIKDPKNIDNEHLEINQEVQEVKNATFKELFKAKGQEVKKLLKDLEESRELLNQKEKEIKRINIETKLKTLYNENGGREEAFQDYFNKHSEILLDVENMDLLSEIVVATTELTPWAFSTNTQAAKALEEPEVIITTEESPLYEGTVYEKRKY